MIEPLVVAALAWTGWCAAPSTGRTGWRLAVALPVGVAAFVVALLAAVALPAGLASPVGVLVVVTATATAAAVWRGTLAPWPPRVVVLTAAVLVAVVAVVTAAVPLANLTADTYRYLTVAGVLAADADVAALTPFTLQTRSLAVGALHGLAPADPGYLRAVTPLLAASTLAAVGLLVHEITAGLERTTRLALALGAVALLLTNHRFLYNAFYLNGHLLFAVWTLVVVGTCWRRLRRTDDGLGDAAVVGVLGAALVLVRPEGALWAVLVVLPAVLDDEVPIAWRRLVLGLPAVASLVWHAGVLLVEWPRSGEPLGADLVGPIALAVLVVAVAAALPLPGPLGRARPLLLVHVGLWAAVAVLGASDPTLLRRAVGPTVRNVLLAGGWGVSLALLAMLLTAAALLRRVPGESAWLFPIVSFVPFGLLLAFLRGGGYRVGAGDSLNRMLLHVVPIAVVGLAATAIGVPRRRPAGADVGAAAGARDVPATPPR